MKQIKLDDDTINLLVEQFKNHISTNRFSTEKVNFSANISVKNKNIIKPTVIFDAKAYLKMLIYIDQTSTEIAWGGTVVRDENEFYITDVFLYPQYLSGATVQTDQTEYTNWLETLDDDTINTLRFQGHSHVNFSPSPSGTDIQCYEDILKTLPKNDYYIFMIMNKSKQFNIFLYDLATNIIYDTTDINIKITETDLIKTINEEKQTYCKAHTYLNITPKTTKTTTIYGQMDINDLIDSINKKYKNPKINLGGKSKK